MLARPLHHDVPGGHTPEALLKIGHVARNLLAQHLDWFQFLKFDSQRCFHITVLVCGG